MPYGPFNNPVLNEFYWASLGKGSWCNNKRLRVSKRHDLTNCLIGTGIPFGNRVYNSYYNELDNISKNSDINTSDLNNLIFIKNKILCLPVI